MKTLDYLFAARPMLHLPVWSVYLISLERQQSALDGGFGWNHLLTMIGLSLMAAGAFYVNQIFDYESDAINDKLGFLQRGLISPGGFMLCYIVLPLLGTAIGGLRSPLTLLVFLQGFVFAWVYSSPPLRLKDRPLAGLLANGYCFGFLNPLTSVSPVERYVFTGVYWTLPLYFFLTVAAVYILTTLPDRRGDADTGKRTIAVAIGTKASRWLALLLTAGSVAVAWRAEEAALAYLSLFAGILILMTVLFGSARLDLFAAKAPLVGLTLLAGWDYPFYLLFIVALVIGCRIYYLRRFGVVYPSPA